MLFLVRSAFWLGMVYSAMPFDNSEQSRELARLRAALAATAATAGGAALAACADQSAACRALRSAMPESPRGSGAAISAQIKEKPTRASPNTLTQADLAPPWRGKPAKFAKREALAKRSAMPI